MHHIKSYLAAKMPESLRAFAEAIAMLKLCLSSDYNSSSLEEAMDAFFGFLKVLVLCVAGLIALLIVVIVLVNYLPRSPLRDILGAFSKRIGATVAVTVVAIPVQPILGVDSVYDLVSTIFLLWYWFTIIKEIRTALDSY